MATTKQLRKLFSRKCSAFQTQKGKFRGGPILLTHAEKVKQQTDNSQAFNKTIQYLYTYRCFIDVKVFIDVIEIKKGRHQWQKPTSTNSIFQKENNFVEKESRRVDRIIILN